jgi:hypothetical protein
MDPISFEKCAYMHQQSLPNRLFPSQAYINDFAVSLYDIHHIALKPLLSEGILE